MAMTEEARINKNLKSLTPLSPKKLQELHQIELRAIAKFAGPMDELESAIGFLHLGFQFGWKPLAIVHSKKTFKKYEQILDLDIDIKEFFPAETDASDRSRGYSLAKTFSNFWKAVNGEEKVDHKRELSSS